MSVYHANLTGSDLHEEKGIASAEQDKVYVADGIGSGDWEEIPYEALPSGFCVGFSNASTSAVVNGIANTPVDDTIPQSSENYLVLSCTHTPKGIGNLLKIRFVGSTSTADGGTDYYQATSLYKDSDTSAIAATYNLTRFNSAMGNMVELEYIYTTTSLNPITFKIRHALGNVSGLTGFNAQLGGTTRVFGGVSSTILTVQEFKV